MSACRGLRELFDGNDVEKNNTKAISIPIHSSHAAAVRNTDRTCLRRHVMFWSTILYFGLNYTIRARGIQELGSSVGLIWER